MYLSREPESWRIQSPTGAGLHPITVPGGSSPYRSSYIYRLNLPPGHRRVLELADLELCGTVIAGWVDVRYENVEKRLNRLDSFYRPGGRPIEIRAGDGGAVLYLGGGVCAGVGCFYTRALDRTIALGGIRQIHGQPPYEREVFMTVDPGTPASRLIAGITWGAPAGWTSWPPHQHESDLEETYCYFDIPPGKVSFHCSYRSDQTIRDAVVYPVASGDFALVPHGYHPTVAPPGVRSTYLWILVAHTPSSRRYDLMVVDPSLGRSEGS